MHRYRVPRMTCGHCAHTVEKAIKGVDARAALTVDLAAKEVTVRTDAEEARIAEAIRSAGYEIEKLGA